MSIGRGIGVGAEGIRGCLRRGVSRPRPAGLQGGRRTHSSPLASSRGATLVEILVSVVIIGITIVPIFDGFMRGRAFVTQRSEERMALRLIERKAEQLLNAGYGSAGADDDVTSVNVTSGTHPADPSIVLNTWGDDDGTNDIVGSLTWTVTNVDWPSPGETVYAKIVDITLGWPISAPEDSVSVTLLIGK
jgi:type II secretory pathway pseudopilin PulG